MLYLCTTEGEAMRFPLFFAPKCLKTRSKVVKTSFDVVKKKSDVVFQRSEVVNFSTVFGTQSPDFSVKMLIIVKTLHFLIFIIFVTRCQNFRILTFLKNPLFFT